MALEERGNGLASLFRAVLRGYDQARLQEFGGHPLASLIRDDIPEKIRGVVPDDERFQIKGSPGNGRWAEVAWAAIFDSLITSTAQSGYYLVYLFKSDLSGIYLSLNQGVTSVRQQYGSGAHRALATRARDFQSRIEPSTAGLILGEINLASYDKFTLGSYYDAGAICSIFYPATNIPSDDQLSADLRHMMGVYGELVARDERLYTHADPEEDEVKLGVEDARRLREHKRIERNRGLAHRAKRHHGYACKACGFDFEKVYGALGHQFIEAHHLVPLSNLRGQELSLSPERDFTVLCANCHRMIHKTDLVGDVAEFRSRHLSTKQSG
ncbi:DUF3578 domain-containing protein [Sphingomonas sp. AOB5]|uniref:MrcB family domain-containing protein n=1 Tax=Sphingomonas sp. AOB5 TaxID=3034017 RepID=UPI0023F6459D|nr:DUF3578 domain-containing protein [Sphingomonas sp. AOB5]MDF7775913.1 DUF3578 domain-containing protein [Sphingomonas sp. AOB5]